MHTPLDNPSPLLFTGAASPLSDEASPACSSSDEDFPWKDRTWTWKKSVALTVLVIALVFAVLKFAENSSLSQAPAGGFLQRGASSLPDAADLDDGLQLQDMNGSTISLDVEQQEERAERLQNGETKTVFHQTTPEACKGIMANGFHAGAYGIAGPGMYFAEKASHTAHKAEHFGCMIEAQIKLGHTKELTFSGDRRITGEKLLQKGYDSVWMPRGWPAGTMPEWVVYFPDQITGMTSYPCTREGRRINSHHGSNR